MTTAQQTTPPPETIRAAVHGMWANVANQWADHADFVDDRLADLTRTMLARIAPERGERVLELACGPGGAGLAASEAVGPDGEVVLSDVAAEMAVIAADRAAARGLTNVRTATLDLEHIDQPDESYDVVLCREGLMFTVEPGRAAGEIHRVLRPGGQVAVSVWGTRAQNPWLAVQFDAVAEETGRSIPPPGIPGPLSLGDPIRLRAILTDAHFHNVTIEEIAVPMRAPSFEVWWKRTCALSGPLLSVIAALPPDVIESLTDRLRTAVRPYVSPAGVELPGLALLATATRA